MTDIICPTPMAPCQDCLDHPQHADENAVIVFCSHHRVGGLYIPDVGLWELSGPFIEEAQFRRYLAGMIAGKLKTTATA